MCIRDRADAERDIRGVAIKFYTEEGNWDLVGNTFAREQDKKAIYLTCNKFNQHSLDVYRAKGFKDIDSVQTDIGQGFIMDDYILQLELDDGK